MSGLETSLKSTRPKPGHYETKTETASKNTETETLKIGLEPSLLVIAVGKECAHNIKKL